jgi:DNA-binding NarL/FixJ family response regulator
MSDAPSHAIVLDDHPLVGRGIAHYLEGVRPDLVVRVAQSWQEGEALMKAHGCPSALIADIWLAEGNSLDGLDRWLAQCPGVFWLAMSGDDDPHVAGRARAAGAHGFIHKQAPPETFARAFDAVLAGQGWFEATADAKDTASPREWEVTPAELGLTQRQGEILALVLRGLSNKRIAQMLAISESTVKEHLTGILERLRVRSRVEAITALRGRRIALQRPA